MRSLVAIFCFGFFVWSPALHAAEVLDEQAGKSGEWGFRPAEGSESDRNPPSFSWRPQQGAARYHLQVARDTAFEKIDYEHDAIEFNVHCPGKVLASGSYLWRFRAIDGKGVASAWSKTRRFSIAESSVRFPIPTRDELLARIPAQHPRLFLRPEDLPGLRERARGKLREPFGKLRRECDELIRKPPSTEEPPKYPAKVKRLDEQWREIWWGNRMYTIEALNSAAKLGFVYRITGERKYGDQAKRILLECAKWDPKGATGYVYNDEAGMPYAYYFSRTYTFVHDLLDEREKERCVAMMRIRGEEMYRHLNPRHLWKPYSSHSNRAWHFLGEVAIAFHGEIPEADDWLWFAVNVFANVYPVWSDSDGGWHEGCLYWGAYIGRFTWWADVMKRATGIDAFQLPYFSKIGYYKMYLQPPGTVDAGFGDLNARVKSSDQLELMTALALQSGNAHWQWYVDQHGGSEHDPGYIGFLRRANKQVGSEAPTSLLSSRCFRGTGQAVLNSNLLDAKENVQIIFKSSPFGTQSHGYESNNSFLLNAYGKRMFIRTGRRDIYGSKHHKQWMWHTRSTNCITANGEPQRPHDSTAQGRITAFKTSAAIDYVEGEATAAYRGNMKRFSRGILFIKPDLIVISDRLETEKASTFQWYLHAPVEMTHEGAQKISVVNEDVIADVAMLAPAKLKLSYTDRFDPPPRERVQLTEYHLTAHADDKAIRQHFVTVIRVRKKGGKALGRAKLDAIDGGYRLRAPLHDGHAVVLLRGEGGGMLKDGALQTKGDVAVALFARDAETSKPRKVFSAGGEPGAE